MIFLTQIKPQDPVHETLGKMLDLLGSAFSLKFMRKLKTISQQYEGVLPFSTLCSGSDVICHVLKVLTRVFKERYNCDLQFKHTFSCESDSKRQSFINSTWSPDYIFNDITKMAGKSAYDVKSKRSVPCSYLFLVILISWHLYLHLCALLL